MARIPMIIFIALLGVTVIAAVDGVTEAVRDADAKAEAAAEMNATCNRLTQQCHFVVAPRNTTCIPDRQQCYIGRDPPCCPGMYCHVRNYGAQYGQCR